jgi:4-amino-4-deoxy-L-arabinose transferase-like glycosyltransferase
MSTMSAERSPLSGDARAWRAAVVITAAAALVRLLLAAVLPLFPDETYYWDWSRHLAGGYFDHPPMIALLIRGGTSLGSLVGAEHTPLAVRGGAVLAGAIASLATAAIARRLGGGVAARTASIVLAVMPLVATGLVLATPDAPLLAASAVGLHAVVRALESPKRSWRSLSWWTAAGFALGLAFASKYTAILLPVAITIAVVLRPALRARLREPGPYVACVVATLVFLPVLQWNAANDWISFRFQLQHGLGTAGRGSALTRELELIGGQLGLVSPIVFVLMANAVWRTLRRPVDDVHFALATVATASWVFFVYSALHKSVEANWPAPSYVPGVALLAALSGAAARDRWLRRGTILAAVLVAVVYLHVLHPVIPLRPSRDQTAKNAGWSLLTAEVVRTRETMAHGARSWIAADRYQDVSELAFHSAVVPGAAAMPVFCVCLGGRRNQYALWPGFAQVAQPGDALIVVLDDTPGVHGAAVRLAPYFTTVTRAGLAPLLRNDDTVGVRRLWVLEGYRGGWPARDDR